MGVLTPKAKAIKGPKQAGIKGMYQRNKTLIKSTGTILGFMIVLRAARAYAKT